MTYFFICLVALLTLARAPDHQDHEYDSHIHMTFVEIDTNRDGVMTKDEFINVFQTYDGNKDGVVTKDEYIHHFTTTMLHHLDYAVGMFSKYDQNQDHLLEKSDFDAFFPLMDADGDGQVTMAEHKNYWNQVYPHNNHAHSRVN